MRKLLGVVGALVLIVIVCTGCALNTNSTKGSVNGAMINTPFGQIAIGGIEFHTLYTDLKQEHLTIHDKNYYDVSASLGVDSEAGIVQAVSRDYKVILAPVEQSPVVQGTWGVGDLDYSQALHDTELTIVPN